MKRPITPTYTFTPGTGSGPGTLNLSGISGFDVRCLFAVVNLTTSALVYAPTTGFGFTALTGSTLTLASSMAGMSSTDKLMILYDDGGKPAEDASLQALLQLFGTPGDLPWDGVAANPSLLSVMKGIFLQGLNTAPVHVLIDGQPIATTGTSAASVPVNSAVPTITGTSQVGQTLAASTGTWSGSPTSYAYQWSRSGTAISGATASTYAPVTADIGATLSVSVVATNATGSSTPASSASTAVVSGAPAAAPVNSAAPAITGTAQVGQTLTVSNGTWSNSPTGYAYQWKRGGAAISGATGQTYVPVSADLGAVLTCTVTATNSGGSAAATSAGTSAVIDAVPGQPTGLAITGRAQTSISLSWTAPSTGGAPTDYLVLYRVSGTGAFTMIDDGTTATSATVTGLAAGTSYDFQVEASDSGGLSAVSGTVTGSTSAATTPGQADFSKAANSGLVAALAA